MLDETTKVKKLSGGSAASKWTGYDAYEGWTTLDPNLASRLRASRVINFDEKDVKEKQFKATNNDIQRGMLAMLIGFLKDRGQ